MLCDFYKTTIKNNCVKSVFLTVFFLINTYPEVFAAGVKQQPASMAAGSLLPHNRIIGYYGNFLSTRMGVLGEYPPDQMLSMLESEMRKWALADPETPTIPAIEYDLHLV